MEFENNDPQAQPHNLVFTKPDCRMKVFADMMPWAPKPSVRATSPPRAVRTLKEGDEVVAISLLKPGESGSATFTAPDKAGAYPFAHLSQPPSLDVRGNACLKTFGRRTSG